MNNPHKGQNYAEEDKQKCPFYQKKLQQSPYDEKIHMSSCKKNKKRFLDPSPHKQDFKKIAENENNEENFEGSGCPIMKTKKENKNPGLFIPEPTFPVPYVSPFSEFLQQNPKIGKEDDYKNWNNYPIYLKETLFYYAKNFKDLRKVEVGYKFFATDELREKANLHYNKKEYQMAINLLSKAISIFKWLETDFPNNKKNKNVQDIKENKLKDNFEHFRQFENFFDDELNFLMFQHFNDKNVTLFQYETSKEKQDVDMEKNTLFGLYQNLAICFMKNGNHYEAKQAIKDIEALGIRNSIFYFRKAQVVFGDSSSTIEELHQSYKEMQLAIEMKQTEEIYTHNLRFLKMFSLENHDTIFKQLLDDIELKIIQVEAEENKNIEQIVNKMQQYLNIEQQILNRGLVPEYSNQDQDNLFQIKDFEFKLVLKISEIYKNAIEFYSREDDKSGFNNLIKGYKDFLRVQSLFEKWWCLDTQNILNNKLYQNLLKQKDLQIDEKKQINLIQYIAKEKAKSYLDDSQIDLSIYQYAVQNIVDQYQTKDICRQQQNKKQYSFYFQNFKNYVLQAFSPKNQILILFVFISLLIVFFNFFGKSEIF